MFLQGYGFTALFVYSAIFYSTKAYKTKAHSTKANSTRASQHCVWIKSSHLKRLAVKPINLAWAYIETAWGYCFIMPGMIEVKSQESHLSVKMPMSEAGYSYLS